MRHRDSKTFLDEDFKLKMSLFDSFPIDTIVSIDHIQLLCAVKGIELDMDLVLFILSGSVYVDNLYNILIDALNNDTTLDNYANSLEFIEAVYKLHTFKTSTTYAICQEWFNRCSEALIDNYWQLDAKQLRTRMYTIMKILDAKFPYLLIQFYSKHKRTLHQLDAEFVNLVLKRYILRAEHDSSFKSILRALENEIFKQRNISMFMN